MPRLDAGCEKPAKPLREDLKAWLLACRGQIPNGSSSAKADDYTLKRLL
jgi:hypothetical protein